MCKHIQPLSSPCRTISNVGSGPLLTGGEKVSVLHVGTRSVLLAAPCLPLSPEDCPLSSCRTYGPLGGPLGFTPELKEWTGWLQQSLGALYKQ